MLVVFVIWVVDEFTTTLLVQGVLMTPLTTQAVARACCWDRATAKANNETPEQAARRNDMVSPSTHIFL